MRRAVTAEIIQMKFCVFNPWLEVIIYLKRHPNCYRGLEGTGVRIFAFPPLTLALTSHTRDKSVDVLAGAARPHAPMSAISFHSGK